MNLLTKEEIKRFAKQGYVGDKNPEDIKIIVHYFSCWTNWDWWAYEFNAEDKIFYGYVKGFEKEFGAFSLQEFEELNAKKGFAIVERDLHWDTNTRLSEILDKQKEV